MNSNSTWHPMPGGKRPPALLHYPDDEKSQNGLDPLRVAGAVLAVSLVAVFYLLETNPGARELLRSLIAAIWGMVCNVAYACRDFFEFMRHQGSVQR